MICKNTTVARLTCTLLFPAGSWSTAGTTTTMALRTTASVKLVRGGVTYAVATQVFNHSRVSIKLRKVRALVPGVYQLKITLSRSTGKPRTFVRVVRL